jgi:ATP-binding cassette subfamily B protein
LRRRKELDYIRFQQSGENNNTLIDMIQGMQEIKLQGSERKRRWIWTNIQAKLFHTSIRTLNLVQWQEAGAAFINQSKNIVITFFAAKAVIDGQMTLGMMLATQYMVGQLDAPLIQFIAFIRLAQDAKISLERMEEIQIQADESNIPSNNLTPVLSCDSAILPGCIMGRGAGDKIPPVYTQGDILIENLSFRYNALHEDVLSDIHLTIPHGKVTAIVGMSGSGKTTLIKLLLGFYQPTKGRILIGNNALTSFTPSDWRKQCGAVMQDGFIFSDTIANNISECDDYPSPSKLINAVEIANIRDFIEALPIGYNTMIGAQGNGVSQGQRQRLLIARAVYKNPDYLFFDEATNALDANNERCIVENMKAFYEDKTVIVVAHRLSTVRHADQIAVLNNGRLNELGSHEDLVALKGAYYHLVKNQLELGS